MFVDWGHSRSTRCDAFRFASLDENGDSDEFSDYDEFGDSYDERALERRFDTAAYDSFLRARYD